MSESGSAGERASQDPADRDQPQSRDGRGDQHRPAAGGHPDGPHGPDDPDGRGVPAAGDGRQVPGAGDGREIPGAGDGREIPGAGDGRGGQRPQPADEHRAPDPWAELMRLADQIAAGRGVGALIPAWRLRARGEMRWPVTVTVAVAVVLQIQLSDSLTRPLPHYLLPGLEIALGAGLFIANPVRFERRGPVVRAASIGLILLITGANAVSAILLIRAIILALPNTASALPLLASGASVWATNVIAFGLWYWEFDRGGPFHRAEGTREYPDLMFPQMVSPQLAAPDWRPYFIDYLYLSFTNATAFSPTDVMPLSRWAKITMAVQSAVALAVGALVIARAVNILR